MGLNHHIIQFLWQTPLLLVWTGIFVLALVRKDSGRWWMATAAGSAVLLLWNILWQVLNGILLETQTYSSAGFTLVRVIGLLMNLLGWALVAAGIFMDRTRQPDRVAAGPSSSTPPPPPAPR